MFGKEVTVLYNNIGILSMARTPIGSFGGSLKDYSAVDLATLVIREAVKRSGLDPAQFQESVMGCVGQYGTNMFLGRLAAVRAGLPVEVTGQTVNRMCASGLQAIIAAADFLEHTDGTAAVAGGAESMSNYPYSLFKARWGYRMGDEVLRDELMNALLEPFGNTHIGVTAENIAETYNFTRQALDAYALGSQEAALAAIRAGRFSEEIVPVSVRRKKECFLFDTDEYPRETSLDKLGRLQPVFKADSGRITAGNASGINDAAAAVVLVNLKQIHVKPLARLLDYAVAGVDPAYMGLGPVPATKELLRRNHMGLADIDLFEINEAFSAQAMACIQELGIDTEKVNVNGSGISLGHPIGATGAIISIKLIQEMRRRKLRFGVVSLCIGGGQGFSALFEVSDL